MAKKQLRVVVVGCGNMSRAWLNTATKMSEIQVAGLVDINHQAAVDRATQYSLPESVVFDSLADAIRGVSPDIVFDVTVPEAHDKVTIQALRAGCHVLGEKPMSVTLPRARKMVEEAKKAGRLYAVIQNRRYEPNIQRVAKLLRSGKLGPIEELHSDFYLGPRFGGFRDAMDYPLLVDMAIHTFDAARYISGADPVSVYCHSFNPARSWYKGDASAVAIFEMTGGVVYTYRGSWCADGVRTSWNSQWRAVCRRGSLLWDGDTGIQAQAHKRDGKPGFMREMVDVPVPDVTVKHQAHEGLIREFVRCVQTGRQPQTHGEDNIRSLAMVLAAVKSARTGRRVKVQW